MSNHIKTILALMAPLAFAQTASAYEVTTDTSTAQGLLTVTTTFGTRNDFGWCPTNDAGCIGDPTRGDGSFIDISTGRPHEVAGFTTTDEVLSDWLVGEPGAKLFGTGRPFDAFLKQFSTITSATFIVRHAGLGNAVGNTLTSDVGFSYAITGGVAVYPFATQATQIRNSATLARDSQPEIGIRTTDTMDVTANFGAALYFLLANGNPNGALSELTVGVYSPLISDGAVIDYIQLQVTGTPATVPLPAAAWLLLGGLGSIVAASRRRVRPAVA